MTDNYLCSRCSDTLVYYEDVEENGVLVRKLQNCDCREKRRFRAYCNNIGVLPEKNPELEAIIEPQVFDLRRSIFLNGQGIRKAHIVHMFTAFLIAEDWPEYQYYTVQNFIDSWFSKERPIEGDLLLVTGYHEIHLDYWEDAVIATLDKKIQSGSRVWIYLDNNRFPELRRYCYQNLQRIELPGGLNSDQTPRELRPSSTVSANHEPQGTGSPSAADRAIDDAQLSSRRY